MAEVNVNKISIAFLQVEISDIKNKSGSVVWKYFGRLKCVSDGKVRTLLPDKLFCNLCLDAAKQQAGLHPKRKSAECECVEDDDVLPAAAAASSLAFGK